MTDLGRATGGEFLAACRATARRRFPRVALRDRRGAASLEFALAGSVLMTLTIGIVETGRYAATRAEVRAVAAEAVRLALIRGGANRNAGAAPCLGLSGDVRGQLRAPAMLRSADLSATFGGCDVAGGTTTVTVTVTYAFAHAVPFVPGGPRLLREEATATIR